MRVSKRESGKPRSISRAGSTPKAQISKPALVEVTQHPADRLRWLILGLAALGAMIAAYLTYIHVADLPAFCGGLGNCEAVNKGPYSTLAGIPVATFGLAMYLALIGLTGVEARSESLQTYGPLLVFALALFGVIFSAYLTYLELFVIEAICPWCVASAILVTLILGASIVRLRRAMRDAG